MEPTGHRTAPPPGTYGVEMGCGDHTAKDRAKESILEGVGQRGTAVQTRNCHGLHLTRELL